MRKLFSAELADLAGPADAFVYNKYKSVVTAKGNMAVGDLLAMKSIDGRDGLYIVNQKGTFEEDVGGGTKETSEIVFLKPLKACHVFNGARLVRKSFHLMIDASYALSLSNPFGHIIDAKVKTTRSYPVYLSLGLVYGMRPGELNGIGIKPGVESFLSIDNLFGFQTGLGMYMAFGISFLYDFQGKSIMYVPDLELGARWYLNSEFAVNFGIRFADEFYKDPSGGSGEMKNRRNACLALGVTKVL